jgi:peptide/nickel transport system substrate-binding protein
MVHRRSDRVISMSRRRFLKTSAGVGFSVIAAANGAKLVAQESSPVITSFQESPLLTEQVNAGALPPVAERLPPAPLVVDNVESVGKYGGTWRTALIGGSDTPWLGRTVGYDNLLRWDPEWEESLPNVAESWEVSEDYRTWTFKLRPGMRWSDGAPFTSADVEFAVNDVYRNPELTTSPGLNPYTVEVVDEQTFILTYELPAGLFLKQKCDDSADTRLFTRFPRHYLEQFHKTYNTTNLDQLIADAGAADWVELFRMKGLGIPGTPYDATWGNPELPGLYGWKLVEPYADAARTRVERNPYYWKVDPAGNQLPYIDEVIFDQLQDAEVLLLKAANGEIDMHVRHIVTEANKPVLADAQESGGFHFFETQRASMNTVSIALNLTHKDPVTRQIFQNIDFRIGLSHAINRQEIIDTIMVSQGEPWQLAPRRETPYFNELLAKQYTEFDVELANQHLDKVLPEKDGDGKRLRPDGQRLVIAIEYASGLDPYHNDSAPLIAGYWQEVGIDAQTKPEDRSLLYTRKDANDHDCVLWGGDGGLKDAMQEPRWYFPYSTESNFAEAWAVWYAKISNPQTAAEEPPEAARQQMDLYEQIKLTGDPEEQNALFAQILEIAQQQFWAMGISLPAPGYGIVKNTMKNVPPVMPDAAIYPQPGPTNPQQYFFDV